jgi:hypothetical protein
MESAMKSFALAGFALLAALPAQAAPTVVELFQSQGCSSCPPAIANVNALAARPDVLALMFAVTYWDQLGWKDTFAKPEFTARQVAYGRRFGDGAYTPEVVINGRTDLVGADRHLLDAAISHATPLAGPPLSLAGNKISVGAASGNAEVWLVRYDPRVQNVPIGAGENGGITIAHKNIVRQMVRLGGWVGAAQSYALPAGGDPAWRSAVLVQEKDSGPILSALPL